MAFEPIRVCVMGAESTGKTTLARALALHFSGLWVPDCRHLFCDQHGRPPREDELTSVMRAQCEHEERVVAQARQMGCHHVICDTAPLLTAIYSDLFFADTCLYPSAQALYGGYALTLLLPPDAGRGLDTATCDGGQTRALVHQHVKNALRSMHYPCIEVSGVGESRLQAAISAVQTLTL